MMKDFFLTFFKIFFFARQNIFPGMPFLTFCELSQRHSADMIFSASGTDFLRAAQ
jgi:hypothetical protein